MKNDELSFSYEEYVKTVRKFAIDVPQILLRHHLTSQIAFEIDSLRLLDALDERFTVAIIGQMRVGKSMLLNSLIGKQLAPTGVTETTATINWFRHGTGDICNNFRVHWNDGSEEDVDLSRIGEWIGTEKNIEKTRIIDFFADTDFLRTSNVVDTPGTRSVIGKHEEATQGFLAEKLEKETMRFGGRADAVIYAINPVGREADSDLLKLFGERTRLPGASAYNSIAVVQKWEHLEPDPLEQVELKCNRLKEQLTGKVAEIIPTSGLIAYHVATVSDDILDKLAILANGSSPESLDMLLLSEQDFIEEYDGLTLPCDTRKQILENLSWKVLPLSIREIRKLKLDNASLIRKRLDEISGLPRLKEVLHRNFFSRNRLIKAFAILKKAQDPCNKALLLLKETILKQGILQEKADKALEIVKDELKQTSNIQYVKGYIEASLNIVKNDCSTLGSIQNQLDDLWDKVKNTSDFFDDHIRSLQYLEDNKQLFTDKEYRYLSMLIGGMGTELSARLGDEREMINLNKIKENNMKRLEYYSKKFHTSSGEKRQIYAHACNILHKILDHLDDVND